jgi:urease accessory protein
VNLQVFRSLPVAREVERVGVTMRQAYAEDTITLGWEDRVRARGRRTSDSGFEFGLALPRGTVLRAGDRLVFDSARTVVSIVERDEPVFILTPGTPCEWALAAYQIGNTHQPVMITDEGILCPDVPGVEQVLRLHGIAFHRAVRPFTPVGLTVDHRH